MKIALLNTKDTPRARYILDCLRHGMQQHGDQCFWIQQAGDMQALDRADVGVQVCAANRHATTDPQGQFRLKAQELMRAQGKRLLIVDTGFVRNQYEYELTLAAKRGTRPQFSVRDPKTFGPVDKLIYYELTFDDIKGRGDHCYKAAPGRLGIPADLGMPAWRWKALNCQLLPWRERGQHILILGQPLHGQSSQDVNIFDWYQTIFTELSQYTNRMLLVRQHPRYLKGAGFKSRLLHDRERLQAHLPVALRTRLRWSRCGPLPDDLAGAWAAVVYSSNAGVSAVLAGVPLFVGSEACVAATVANHSLRRIETPKLHHREPWARALAWAQWCCLEMRDGTAWSHYRPFALKPAALKETP